MRRSHLAGFLIAFNIVLALSAAKADIMPPLQPMPDPPPPPVGAEKTSLRGVELQRVYTYWKGRRWMTVINNCDASQSGCTGKTLAGCFVVSVDDHRLEGGSTEIVLDPAADALPVKLTLENCAVNEINLNR